MWMPRNLHSGIRCPVEDDPPGIRAPNPGAIGYSVTRLRDFLILEENNTTTNKNICQDVEAVRLWRYHLWRMQSLERDTQRRKKNLKKKKKEKKEEKKTAPLSTSFGSGIGDGGIISR